MRPPALLLSDQEPEIFELKDCVWVTAAGEYVRLCDARVWGRREAAITAGLDPDGAAVWLRWVVLHTLQDEWAVAHTGPLPEGWSPDPDTATVFRFCAPTAPRAVPVWLATLKGADAPSNHSGVRRHMPRGEGVTMQLDREIDAFWEGFWG